MRKFGKYILVILLSIFLLGFISFYGLKYSISKNLETKSLAVKNSWQTFNNKLSERDSLLVAKYSTASDSLKYLLNKSRNERLNKKNSLDIGFNEYQVNKFVMNQLQESDTNILDLNSGLNTLIIHYNSMVQDYNFYYSMFPNFFFAKKMKLKKEKYFEIEYGKENEDPIVKSRKFPEWAENVDTIM